MKTPQDRDLRKELEEKLEEWFDSILPRVQKDDAQTQKPSQGLLTEIKIAALSVVSDFLAGKIRDLTMENQPDKELQALAEKAMEHTNALSEVIQEYTAASSISGFDDIPNNESANVEDEPSAKRIPRKNGWALTLQTGNYLLNPYLRSSLNLLPNQLRQAYPLTNPRQ